MNVAIVISICAVVVAAVPIYFLAKSNARDNERMRREANQKDIDNAVADAVAPLQSALAAAQQGLADEKATTARLRARIDELQDKLYGRNQ